MVLRKVVAAAMCATLCGWSSLSAADEYRAGEFFNLDLSKAVLSPKPLGPSAGFTPAPASPSAAQPVCSDVDDAPREAPKPPSWFCAERR